MNLFSIHGQGKLPETESEEWFKLIEALETFGLTVTCFEEN